MPLIYSLVSFKSAVAAEATAAGLAGNFAQVAKTLVKKLPSTNSKLSYIYDAYMFHYIILDNWVYLCICDLKYERMLAFKFLNEVMEFVKTHPDSANSAAASGSDSAAPSSSLQSFLVKHMEKYNTNLTEKHHKLYSDISSLKDTMTENVDLLLERGEKIDLLVDKSDVLQGQSITFQKSSKKLKDEMWWKNTKLLLIIAGVTMFVLYLIISSSCGGMTWPQC